MAKPNFTLPNKPAIKSGSILSYNYTDDFTFVPAPLTFNRDSAATRVNEKGLIEDVGYFGPELVQNGDFEQIGSELVTNGDFATDINGWNAKGSTIIWDSGKLKADNSSGNSSGGAWQNINLDDSKQYKITMTMQLLSGDGNGTFGLITSTNFGSEQSVVYEGQTLINGGGSVTETFYFTPASGDVSIQPFVGQSNAIFTIDNVSVKEVGQNWTADSNWTIDQANNKAISDGSQSGNVSLKQSNSIMGLTTGSFYKVEFTISNYSSGNINPHVRGNSSGNVNGNGVKTSYIAAGSGSDGINLYADLNFTGSITNISVIEVLGDKPRIDYSDSLTEPSLLLEPQSTNLIPYSEDFSQWALVNGTILSNAITSPSGEINSDKFTFNSSYAQLRYTLTVASSTQYSASFYVKNLDSTNVEYRIYDVTNGTDILSSSYYIQISNTEWTRVSFEFNTSATTSSIYFYPISGSYSGSLFIWGAQLEQLSYPTSYIPTAGSTATRLGETANNAGDVNVFNSEEGVLYAEIAALANDSTYKQFTLNAGSPNDSIRLMYTDVNNQVRYFVRRSASTQADITYTLTDATQFNKIAMVYKANDFQLWVNGIKVGTDTSGTPPSGLSTIDFNDGGTSSYFYGNVKNVQVFNKALTDRELEILTIQ